MKYDINRPFWVLCDHLHSKWAQVSLLGSSGLQASGQDDKIRLLSAIGSSSVKVVLPRVKS